MVPRSLQNMPVGQNSLLSGERSVWSLKVVYSPPSKPMNEFEAPATGTLLLTNYRVQFSLPLLWLNLEENPDFYSFPGVLSRFSA